MKNWHCVYILSISGIHRSEANKDNAIVSVQAAKEKSIKKFWAGKILFVFSMCVHISFQCVSMSFQCVSMSVLYNDQSAGLFSFLFVNEHYSMSLLLLKQKHVH